MDENRFGRREVLRGAAAGGALVAGLGLASPTVASADSRGRRLTGSWLFTRQEDGDPNNVLAVASFAAGHVLVHHDINPAGPPFTGTWRQRGPSWRATFWSGFPGEGGPGSPGASVRIRVRGRHENDTIFGTYDFALFDINGAEIVSGTGTFGDGHRIEA